MREPVIQLEPTGCGIAACAAVAQIPYPQAQQLAAELGIHADDASLWSDSRSVRRLLQALGYQTEAGEQPFTDWQQLPDLALLATKWHLQKGRPYWHWALFERVNDQAWVLDSKAALKQHRRRDFGRIKPKWYIPVGRA